MQFSWKGGFDHKGYTRVIDSDGKGYYMYLPNLFIKKNLHEQPVDNRFIFKTPNGSVNKYYAGTAIAMAPFFGIGYLKAMYNHDPPDGYSPPFQKAISIAGLFYLCIGLFFLSRFLLLYEIRSGIICITLLLLVFGTNLLMYAVYLPSFSHIYSFAFVAIFLCSAKNILSGIKSKMNIFLLAFSFAMLLLIRPTNGIVLFALPFLAGSWERFKAFLQWIFQLKNILIAGFTFFVITGIQLYLWEVQTGELIVWSYKNEGFYFLHPQIGRVLFSFRKGFFVYTPLALLSLCGLCRIYKKSKFQFYWITIFYLLLIYITSAWWCWYYGPSFGQRNFVDFYAVNALLLALLIQEIKYRTIMIFVAMLCLPLNLMQSYQYVHNIISSWDMSAEKYRYTFLKTSDFYADCLGGCDDISPYTKQKTLLLNTKNDFEKTYENWHESPIKTIDNGHHNVCNFENKNYISAFYKTADTSMTRYRLLFAEVQLDRMETGVSGKYSPLVVCSISDAAGNFDSYYTFKMNEVPNLVANEWKTIRYTIEIPKIKTAGNVLQIYIWNTHYTKLYLDNFSVKLYGID